MHCLLRLRAAALLLTPVAFCQQSAGGNKAAQDCGNLSTQIEITNCWEDAAQKADVRLNALYQKIQKAITAQIAQEQGQLKGYQQRAMDKLRAAELAWIHYREAECDAEEQQYEGGTIAPSVHAGCMKDLAERRADELKRTYAVYLKEVRTGGSEEPGK